MEVHSKRKGISHGCEIVIYSDTRGNMGSHLTNVNNKLSCDVFLGLPFNIASYALLTHMLANILDYEVGEFVWTGGDVHLYKNHLIQAHEQLSRTARSLPKLKILADRKINDPAEFKFEDFELEGYDPCPAIKAPIAV